MRVSGPNDIVAGDVRTASDIISGEHVVTPRETPLYTVCTSKQSDVLFEVRKLGAGETTCLVKVPATIRF